MVSSTIAFYAGIISLISGLMICYIGALLIQRYQQKKQKATIYLTFSVYSWALCALIASMVYLTADQYLDSAEIFQGIMYGLVFTATIFTYMFGRNVFFTVKTNWYKVYILLGIIAIFIIGFSDSSYIAYFPDSTNHPALILKSEFGIILITYLLPTLVGIAIIALKTSKRIEEQGYKLGYRFIALSQFFIFLVFVWDTIASANITNSGIYGFFLVSQWILGLIASLFSYLGWVLPDWFKKLYHIPD